MYTAFGNVGFIHANLIQKKKLFTKIKATVGTFLQKKHIGSSICNGSPERTLNTLLYRWAIFRSVENALYKNGKCKTNSNVLSNGCEVYTQLKHLFVNDHSPTVPQDCLHPVLHTFTRWSFGYIEFSEFHNHNLQNKVTEYRVITESKSRFPRPTHHAIAKSIHIIPNVTHQLSCSASTCPSPALRALPAGARDINPCDREINPTVAAVLTGTLQFSRQSQVNTSQARSTIFSKGFDTDQWEILCQEWHNQRM